MFYEYRCGYCGNIHESQTFARIGEVFPNFPCECGNSLIRIVSVPNTTPVSVNRTYFNHTVGDYVTGTKDFERKLREGQRKQSERLGYDQSYVPVYPSEARAYNESAANNDRMNGNSVENYGRIYNKTDDKKTIIT